jgi:hypothetical protein
MRADGSGSNRAATSKRGANESAAWRCSGN